MITFPLRDAAASSLDTETVLSDICDPTTDRRPRRRGCPLDRYVKIRGERNRPLMSLCHPENSSTGGRTEDLAGGAGKEIRTPDLLITSEPAPNAVLPDETAGHV